MNNPGQPEPPIYSWVPRKVARLLVPMLAASASLWLLVTALSPVSATGRPSNLPSDPALSPLLASSSPLNLVWSALDENAGYSAALGDYDGDGDLDLVVGNIFGRSDKLYRNDNGALTLEAAWSPQGSDANYTYSVAWGDVDGDGDLDLLSGKGCSAPSTCYSSRLYRNDNGVLTTSAVWTSPVITDNTRSVAWADYDGDGDLDLAMGNYRQYNKIYRNDTVGVTPALTLVWSAAVTETTNSVAWGDYDGDGDLDLAAGNGRLNVSPFTCYPNKLYRNDNNTLTVTPVYTTTEADCTNSIAWGDYDGDGDLDMAVGNSGPNRLYRNDNGVLTTSAVWTSTETVSTNSVAWGDYDGDGDLDLAAGNDFPQPNYLYRNDNGTLTTSAIWMSPEADATHSVAWGDVDGDGSLDLAVANNGSARLYRNSSVPLITSPVYTTTEGEWSTGVAWGDFDNDGDLDLAVGNRNRPNRLYRNDSGMLTTSAFWTAAITDSTSSVAWGDYDGDGYLDLAVGNYGQPNRLYRNLGGTLMSSPAWTASITDSTTSVAWGDYDSDGDLDLVAGNFCNNPGCRTLRLYRNDSGVLTTVPVWSSDMSSSLSTDVAWGDVDGDGDLDLAVGNAAWAPNQLYRSDRGVLSLAWSSVITESTVDVALGDVDSDGDLDLAVANSLQYVRLYRNDGGTFTSGPVWSSAEAASAYGVDWGDADNDGDLDLAVASYGTSNRVYLNEDGTLTASAVWLAAEVNYTEDVAWGDVDNDGDLDLAAAQGGGGGRPNHVFRNTRDARFGPAPIPIVYVARPVPPGSADDYSSAHIWSGPIIPVSYTLFDGDGEIAEAIRVFFSPDGGGPWYPAIAAGGTVTADLAAGYSYLDSDASGGPTFNWIDISSTGTLITLGDEQVAGPFPIGFEFPYFSQAASQFWISDNGWLTFSPQPAGPFISFVNRCLPSQSALANLIAPFWDDLDPGAAGQVRYQLVDPNTLVVSYIGVPRWADGGSLTFQVILRGDGSITFQYLSMTGTLNSATIGFQNASRNLARQFVCNAPYVHNNLAGRSRPGTSHLYNWDVPASSFFGQSDNIVFRIEAVPAITHTRNSVAGPYLYGAYAAQTFPFRVRGTQVRVMSGTTPATNALVYRLPAGQDVGGELFSDSTGQPFRTDSQGYLQGRGQINLGDRLLALAPITTTETYRLYYTNGAANLTTLDTYTVTAGGVQTLTVSAANPLLLFDAFVSLEWDAHNDPSYLQQLDFNLQRASQYLYDFTNGQAALGEVIVEQNSDDWAFSHLVVHANNRLRPFAAQGGIVLTPTVDPQHAPPTSTSPITYTTGQVHMGSTWNRYGTPGQSLGDDWSVILAHELGHFLLFLDDTYLGLDVNGDLIAVDSCLGSAMGDLYSNPDNTEYITDETYWQANCAQTLAEQTLGRNEWETLDLWYPPVVTPTALNSGPTLMPFNLTQITMFDPLTPTAALEDPTFYLDYTSGEVSSSEARAFLLRNDQFVMDLGSPIGGQNRVLARGAQPGDRLCVFDRPLQQYGCEVIVFGDNRVTMEKDPAWTPVIQISPVTSQTFTLEVQMLPGGLSLQARLYPEYGPGGSVISLIQVGGTYTGTFTLSDVTLAGNVQLWVNETATETNPRRETIVAYSIGGNPGALRSGGGALRSGGGALRSGGGALRSGGGALRSGGAPIISPDGQMIFFTQNPIIFEEGQFYTVQGMAGLPPLPPGRTMIAQGYSLVATPGTPVITGSVSIQYLSNDVLVAGADEDGLTIYFWDGSSWSDLPTTRDAYYNLATAPSQGAGVYALMSSIQIPLETPGWNLFSYPAPTRPVTQALLSISGYYTTVYGHEPTDTADPWKVYDVTVPPFVNDLTALEFNHAYWINISQAITLHVSGGPTPAFNPTTLPPAPPATFYGAVLSGPGFTPTPGMVVSAWITGLPCGQGQTLSFGGQVVYVIDVFADDAPGGSSGCGAPGRTVTFRVGSQPMATTAPWDNSQVWNLTLVPDTFHRLYLPLVRRE